MRRLGSLLVAVLCISAVATAAGSAAKTSAANPAARASADEHNRRCAATAQIVGLLQRQSLVGSSQFGRAAKRRAHRATELMARLTRNAPNHRTAVLAQRLVARFRGVVHSATYAQRQRKGARRAVARYVAISTAFMSRFAQSCPGQSHGASPVAHRASLYSEQQGHHGVNTFTNYHNASGLGPRIEAGVWVQVSCKVYDPYIQSVNPDGYWYRIASAPWNDAYYSPANTFMNGDPWNGPYTHNTDFAVPDCGAPPPPPPATASLAQGPAGPAGYRYAITIDHFSPNGSISVSCRDSINPGGFYTFSLTTDAAGHGFTQSYCYSADGPDHWIVVNGTVESNHVSWSGGDTGSGTGTGSGSGSGPGTGTNNPPGCIQYSGFHIGSSGHVSRTLFGHYLDGTGLTAVIDWTYFSANPQFRAEALPLAVGGIVSGWSAPLGSDMQTSLGHFTIQHPSPNCYLVSDHYDFSWENNKKNLIYFPFWALQIAGAREFDIRASGGL
jgi:hypothetical protein